MNRHLRRAAAAAKSNQSGASGLSGINELLGVAEKLQPYLARIEELQSELQRATQVLREIEAKVSEQRDTFLRMFARGMGVPLATILAMEVEIQHALEIPPTDAETPAKHPST